MKMGIKLWFSGTLLHTSAHTGFRSKQTGEVRLWLVNSVLPSPAGGSKKL